MPENKCEKEVRQRAIEFIQHLSDAGFTSRLLEQTFRDYSVKISIEKAGKMYGDVLVYYKSSNATYTLGTHELKNKDIQPDLEAVWHGDKKGSTLAPNSEEILQAYVDGSFQNGMIGYGVILLRDAQVIEELCGVIDDPPENLISMCQVGGELKAVQEAITWAEINNVQEMGIHYDYQGLEFWATGAWSANNPHVLNYQAFMQNCPIKISWYKVQAHSGNCWNERADELARMGLASKSYNGDALRQEEDLQAAITKLVEVSSSFTIFLSENNILAEFDKIYNRMHSRIIFPQSSGKNFLDIYNTKKKPLDPKWHGFSDGILCTQVQDLWNLFRTDVDSIKNAEKNISGTFLAADYTYSILKPYRSLNFDFANFARLIQVLAADILGIQLNVEDLRYNFDEIEKIYFQLKENING